MEETGLIVTDIDGVENRIDTSSIGYSFSMECVKPFVVYQTLEGPIDSMGVYFKCKAEGKLCRTGDCTKDVRWIDIKELCSLIQTNPLLFSDIDRAGFMFYLNGNT